jgi:hypothetical protein
MPARHRRLGSGHHSDLDWLGSPPAQSRSSVAAECKWRLTRSSFS